MEVKLNAAITAQSLPVYQGLNDALRGTVNQIVMKGTHNAPRGMGTTDLLMYAFAMRDPRDRICTLRSVREGYSAANVMWNIAQRDDVDSICWWNEHGRKISDNGDVFHGANYGQRWSVYLEEAIELLKLDPDSRRPFVPIWQPTDLCNMVMDFGGNVHVHGNGYSRDGKDVPCTIGFGLRIVEGKLVMQCVMRSQAVIGVMPYDIFLFTCLQELIANELEIPLGHYEHVMLSAHTYDRERDWVEQILDGEPTPAVMKPNPTNLTFAHDFYPQVFDQLTFASEVPDDAAREHPDPLVGMMISGAREVIRLREAV